MKRIFITLLFSALVGMAMAQDVKTYSVYDTNQSGDLTIADVTATVNQVKSSVAATSTQQYVTADDLSTLLKSIQSDLKLIKEKLGISDSGSGDSGSGDSGSGASVTESNFLPGKFSVSATKQVQFTKSNLYWDGSAFKFEENQTDYPTEWDANHVSHFYWTNLTDYQSGTAFYMPYAESYSYSSRSTSDKFWCGEDNPLTVEGTSGLYALTGGESGEWYYLINNRTNASSLYRYGVTVIKGGTSYSNCLIIAPDDFTGTLQPSYTLDEVNAAGLVCLPAAGYLYGSSLNTGGSNGYYWSAMPDSDGSYSACFLLFYSSGINPAYGDYRGDGQSVRLVRGI